MLQAEQSRIESVAYVQRIKRLCLYLSVVFDMIQSNSSEWLLCISSEQHVSYSYLWPKDTTTAKSKDPQQARKCRHIRRYPTEINAHNNQESRWKGHCTFLCHTFKQKEGRRRVLFVSASTAALAELSKVAAAAAMSCCCMISNMICRQRIGCRSRDK